MLRKRKIALLNPPNKNPSTPIAAISIEGKCKNKN